MMESGRTNPTGCDEALPHTFGHSSELQSTIFSSGKCKEEKLLAESLAEDPINVEVVDPHRRWDQT